MSTTPTTVGLPPELPLLPDGVKAGGWWHSVEHERIECDLCPRRCVLKEGDRGFCFVRENRAGQMVLNTYGRSTGFCIDPIEKKPLNHFNPGTSVLSFGTAGCNLGCKFCQNWDISKSREIEQLSERATPEMIAQAAAQLGCRSVAFTYNDPVIWAEYAIDTARACRALGVKTVAVTAGYITPAARGAFFENMDAANVDLKAFTEHFYQHLTSSHLEPVLETLRWLKHETDVWFEITNLMIPHENDAPDETRQMCQWILDNLGPDVPVHFTAFHPDFRLQDRPATPIETLQSAYEIAKSFGLHYVYTGNVNDVQHQSTWCPHCQARLIERNWYALGEYALKGDRCAQCGGAIAGRFDPQPGDWGRRRMPVRISQYEPAAGVSACEPTVVQIQPLGLPPKRPITMSTTQSTTAPVTAAVSAAQQREILSAAAWWLQGAILRRRVELIDPTLAGAANSVVHGAFVSLKRQGRLRSCCGSVGAPQAVASAVQQAAARTAVDDGRFPPISLGELPYLDVEVWLLGPSVPVAEKGLDRIGAVQIGKHGLRISRGDSRGLLLPSVAVEHKLSAEEFLEHVSVKAGLPPTAWKEDDATLATFEGQAFHASLDSLLPATPLRTPPLVADERGMQGLAHFARINLHAHLTGATPSYFLPGAADGAVCGVVLQIGSADGQGQFKLQQLALQPTLTLQNALLQLTQSAARHLSRPDVVERLGPSADAILSLPIDVAVLYDTAMHGTVSEPDLGGFDPATRALLVTQRNRSACQFDPSQTAAELLFNTAQAAQVGDAQTASVYSQRIQTTASRIAISNVPRPQAGAKSRPPGVAGRFYPADANQLTAQVDACFRRAHETYGPATSDRTEAWPAVMVPHAALIYSGHLAAATLERVQIPSLVLILGPKHTSHGVDWAVTPHVRWELPGREMAADPEVAAQLAEAIPGLQLDAAAHQLEHAIEIVLPLLHRLAPQSRVVGLAISENSWGRCQRFAQGLADWLQSQATPPLLIVSSDMNHFATDRENRRLDEIALQELETCDPQRAFAAITQRRISMCGVAPAVIVMEALRRIGRLHRMQRVGYGTSADTSGDMGRVVGYAGMLWG